MIKEHPRLREIIYTLNRIFKNPTAVIGGILLLGFSGIAFFAPYLAPPKYDHAPYRMPHKGYSATPKPPNREFYFGRTSGQYDIYYGIIWGARTAFKIGIAVVGMALLIGIILGVLSGYFGGWVDEIIMRMTDIVFAVPLLILAMTIVVAFGRGLDKIIIALALVEWRWYVRVIRSEVLRIRKAEFVQAAKLMGVSDVTILGRHILPNSMTSLLVIASMDMGSMVITAAFMSFVGLGAPRGYADWGQMVALARNYIVGPPDDPLRYWYAIFFPGLAIILFVLAWNLMGDALRDALDPKIRRR
jgi:peptide/nickel transport system permease protein